MISFLLTTERSRFVRDWLQSLEGFESRLTEIHEASLDEKNADYKKAFSDLKVLWDNVLPHHYDKEVLYHLTLGRWSALTPGDHFRPTSKIIAEVRNTLPLFNEGVVFLPIVDRAFTSSRGQVVGPFRLGVSSSGRGGDITLTIYPLSRKFADTDLQGLYAPNLVRLVESFFETYTHPSEKTKV